MFRLPAIPSNCQTPPPARRLRAARLAVLLAASLLIAAWGAQDQQSAPAQPAAPQTTQPAQYVGSDTCGACHEDIYNAFQKSPHEILSTDKKRGWEGKACESCHGPGSKHAESMSAADILNPAKVSPAVADQDCMKCHLNQPTHIGRINASHAKNQVACVACHSIHQSPPFKARKPVMPQQAPLAEGPHNNTEINQLCASCHSNVWASFQKPYKHPLPPGAMSCVDCHNPHGTVLPYSIQTVYANEPGCYKCHGEKRGPFVYEHPPMRLEGCAACHQPHGSQNPRMLTRAQVRFVCLECHANLPAPTPPANGTLGTVPPAFHDLRSPRFQNCTLCHQMIHGSYVNRDFFK